MGRDALKRKFPFLLEYTDSFIKETGVHILIKAETASRKLLDMDRNKKAEDKLYTNREALAMTSTTVPAGRDNRLDILHAARCLPGGYATPVNHRWGRRRKGPSDQPRGIS